MNESVITRRTLPEAYHRALVELDYCGKIEECPDWGMRAKEMGMTIKVSDPLAEPMISKLSICGPRELEQYRMEMLDGILDFEIEKGNWKYTYHDRFADQIPFIIEELKRNPYSRRAVISIRTNDDIGSEDPACMQHMQFQIRNEKLEMSVLFRSNDAVKATFMNMFALIMLQKKIADELGVGVGCYTHRVNNFHCYERDFDLLHKYVDSINKGHWMDLTYDYVSDWKDIMEEYRPEILADVEKLKRQE